MFMFKTWYKDIMSIQGVKYELGMHDTDSYLFKVSNREKFFHHFDRLMDYSNYEETHPKYSTAKKAQLGYFKDELCGKFVCTEFVGLRSKCYAMNLEDEKTPKSSEKRVCKGLGRSAITSRLKFDQYKDCLFKNQTVRHDFHAIRSVNHSIKTVLIRKKALNFFETKRWLFNCGIHSCPYGSYLIKKHGGDCPKCNRLFE